MHHPVSTICSTSATSPERSEATMKRGFTKAADARTAPDAEGDGMMGFLDHLEELRTRLIRSCLAIVAGMAVAALFVDRIKSFVLAPVRAHLPPGTSLVMTGLG